MYEGVSKIFRTDAVKFVNLTTKRVWKLPTSTQLRATWNTDSLDIRVVVLPSIGASRYHNCCADDGTSPEYFVYTLVIRKGDVTISVKSILYCNRNSRPKTAIKSLRSKRKIGSDEFLKKVFEMSQVRLQIQLLIIK
jgi:hypothetical protein